MLFLVFPKCMSAATLTVELAGVTSTEGRIYLALFQGESNFPDGDRVISSQTKPGIPVVIVQLNHLEPGEYALAAYHDLNSNGKLDRNFMGIPIEPYGFSGKPVTFGPDYKKALFLLKAPNTELKIILD